MHSALYKKKNIFSPLIPEIPNECLTIALVYVIHVDLKQCYIARPFLSFLLFYSSADVCEENPKWRALTDVIAEVEETNKSDSTVGKVLIAVNSSHTCNQLKSYLTRGSHSVLMQLLRKLEQPKEQVSQYN